MSESLSEPPEAARRQPRRGAKNAEGIFQATLDLLTDRGYSALTIEGVAERAGVNKTTIYRWWPSKAALVREAVLHSRALEFAIPDTGSLRTDLVAVLTSVIALLRAPDTGAAVRATLSAATAEDDLRTLTHDVLADRLRSETPIWERAVARGELAPATDTVLLADLLGGAVWFRVLFRDLPAGPDFAEQVVDAVLPGFSPRRTETGKESP
ncbi:MAG: hypothetical protein QG622_1065 [Actinomycetota bacterium]|nr:hypothetical protein [Actinomycetota bacterium]